MKKIWLAMTEEMFNDLDRVKDRHYASTVPELSNLSEKIIALFCVSLYTP
jgi:hypothetical protein